MDQQRTGNASKGKKRFRGIYEHTLNKQGRITLPKKFTKILQESGVDTLVMLFNDDRLEVFPENEWSKREENDSFLDEDDNAVSSYQHYRYANTLELDIDQQGRILLPRKWIERLGLNKDVVVLGARDKFEIWSAERFQEVYSEWERSYRVNKKLVSEIRQKQRREKD